MASESFLLPANLEEKMAAFDRVVSSVDADPAVIARLRQRFMDEFPWARDNLSVEEVVQEVLGSQAWLWPWHRKWLDTFERLGAFPHMWTTLSRVRPRALRETGTYDHRICLLAHTLMMACHIERGFAGKPENQDEACISITTDEPEAVQEVIKSMMGDYVKGEGPANPPPFFPGDRTGFRTFGSWMNMQRHPNWVYCKVRARLPGYGSD